MIKTGSVHTDITALLDFTLHLADNALILGQRNSEWTGHGPVLEQDIAMSNIALDLIGQARLLYQYAARQKKDGSSEDSLAFLRDRGEFKNCLLPELPKGDWAVSTLRQYFFSAYQLLLYRELKKSPDPDLAAIAEKAAKEVAYHVRWSGEWVIRLGDGTEESRRRLEKALQELWPYTGELFSPAPYEIHLQQKGLAPSLETLGIEWAGMVTAVLNQATLQYPQPCWMQSGGKQGVHTEHLGYILAEMQFMQRAYPGCEW